MAGLSRFKFNTDEPKFIPLPASWLNHERWADQGAGGLHLIQGGTNGGAVEPSPSNPTGRRFSPMTGFA
jgi:hypothetical protein